MGSPSTMAKQKWNSEHYGRINIRVDKDLAAKFKLKCEENNMSVAGTISKFMAAYCDVTVPGIPTKRPKDNRGKRRREIEKIIAAVEDVLEREVSYMDSIPENLQNGERYAAAEECTEHLEAALDSLREAF